MGNLTTIIPSYLYVQYNDDDNLQGFVLAQNQLTQELMDRLTNINLPIYTGLTGEYLDWVAEGLYGMIRPYLPAGMNKNYGPYNTIPYNVAPFNDYHVISSGEVFITNDDIFKRIITWNFYKGDGFTFNVLWLKRRIMRFLLGDNGSAPNIENTYQISVTFGPNNVVNITLLQGYATVTGGAIYNQSAFNTVGFGQLNTTFTQLTTLENADVLVAAIQSGAVNLPFQYTYDVTILG